MTMLIEGHNDNEIVETVWPRPTWSVDQLEAELKRRIGWVDEVVSPFARRADRTAAPRPSDRH
jgi:hypothetical protein